MNLNFINKSPKLKNWLLKQVNYYSKGLYFFNEGKLLEETSPPSKIIIVAKCHYNETWQSFASVNKKELDKILKLKKEAYENTSVIFQTYKSEAIDGYDVKITTIDNSVISYLGKDKIYLPETELFTPSGNNQLLEVETLAGKLFCSFVGNKVKLSYATGIVKNIETYKLSVGLSDNVKSIEINDRTFPKFILSQLFKLEVIKFSRIASFNIKSWFNTTHLHLLYWAPLITALCFYILSNSYLYFKTNNIEQRLASGGEQVSEIISLKKQLDNNKEVWSSLSGEFEGQSFVHYHWQIIDILLNVEMEIKRINYKDGKLIVRGLADKASVVLSTISEYEKITSASFEGPVRNSRGKDSFILSLEVKGQ